LRHAGRAASVGGSVVIFSRTSRALFAFEDEAARWKTFTPFPGRIFVRRVGLMSDPVERNINIKATESRYDFQTLEEAASFVRMKAIEAALAAATWRGALRDWWENRKI
jgi:hypothetical protein